MPCSDKAFLDCHEINISWMYTGCEMKQNEFIQLLSQNLAQNNESKLRTKIYLAIKAILPQLNLQSDFKCPSTRFLSEHLGISCH